MERRFTTRARYHLPVSAQLRHLGGPMRFGALHAQGDPAAVRRQDRSSVGVISRLAAIVVLGADEADIEAFVAHDYIRDRIFLRRARDVLRVV